MMSRETSEVWQALAELKPWLEAYVVQRLGQDTVARKMREPTGHERQADTQALVSLMLDRWHDTFSADLHPRVKTYLHELKDIRNRAAHEQLFSREDVARARSTIRLVARAIDAPSSNEPPPNEAVDTPRQRQRTTGRGHQTQRSVMRAMYAKYRGNPELIVREYAAAERRGEVLRKNNTSGLSAEDYARALLADGEKKGWLITTNDEIKISRKQTPRTRLD